MIDHLRMVTENIYNMNIGHQSEPFKAIRYPSTYEMMSKINEIIDAVNELNKLPFEGCDGST